MRTHWEYTDVSMDKMYAMYYTEAKSFDYALLALKMA